MELNTAAHQRPHLDLIANIQQENRQLRALESENKELKSALEEHQNTLELIMSKYRQQISRLLEANHAEKSLAKLLPDTRVNIPIINIQKIFWPQAISALIFLENRGASRKD